MGRTQIQDVQMDWQTDGQKNKQTGVYNFMLSWIFSVSIKKRILY